MTASPERGEVKRPVSAMLALFTLSLFVFANVSAARAQSGSAGGSIGERDKSISGVRSAAAPPAKQTGSQEKSPVRSCGRIVGTWSWYLGLSNSTFLKDGTATYSASSATGKWTCAGSTVNVVWNYEGTTRTDHITVSQDGDSILVVSPYGGGIKFTGTRR